MAEMKLRQARGARQGQTVAQRKAGPVLADGRPLAQAQKDNRGGLPGALKQGIEMLSGVAMDKVRVHRNSSKPAQLNALAYAQGNEIHLAPGQERHLPHEAWHVAQQARGRVRPTMQMKGGVAVNDDAGLEREADVMGARAVALGGGVAQMAGSATVSAAIPAGPAQLRQDVVQRKLPSDPHVFEFTDADGLAWFRDEVNRWYRPGLKQGERIYMEPDKIYDLDTIKPDKSTSVLKNNLNILFEDFAPVDGKVGGAPTNGYIGTAIVYADDSAAELAKHYVKNGQDWSEEDRKARLGVNFGINNREDFETRKTNATNKSVKDKATASFASTNSQVTTLSSGFTWGYSYSVSGETGSTSEWAKRIEADRSGKMIIVWKQRDTPVDADTAIKAFQTSRASVGIPYGFMRTVVSNGTKKVDDQLKKNGASPVYIHSLDADAPNFVTLKRKDGSGWKKSLDAYDEILGGGQKALLIGGYNLLGDRGQHKTQEDYNHTVRSNVVDLAIRQAVHSVAPRMTYPTEPNFLIRTDTYQKTKEFTGKNSAWGNMAIEGRVLYDNYLKAHGPNAHLDVAYDPLASVATGVSAGGARLKIEKGKTYDENSLHGKPQADDAKAGDTIDLHKQYIVQAQSLAGASRLSFAYLSAFATLDSASQMGLSPKKTDIIPLFAPVETMVLELLEGRDITFVATPSRYAKVPGLQINQILGAIRDRLEQLKKNPAFGSLVR